MTKKEKSTDLLTVSEPGVLVQTLSKAGYDVVESGEILKWVALDDSGTFTDDEGNTHPIVIEGVLIGREVIRDEDDDGEERERHAFSIRIIRPCPVEYKDENGSKVQEVAQPGEIVTMSSRERLKKLEGWVDDGGVHQVFIKPTRKVKIGKGRTMWLFAVGEKLLKAGPPAYIPPKA